MWEWAAAAQLKQSMPPLQLFAIAPPAKKPTPITIANAMQSAGVMEGKHTLDVGILIMPVLIETMAYLAEEADVEYTAGSNVEVGSDKPSQPAVALALAKVREEQGQEPVEEPMPEETEQMEMELEPPTGGLMSRRA